ncbi:MAG: tetratricopeptide repeat protein [Acidobacteria bacterium]|nr:tetratricopeptide repeat protein [Acidobacteriota bacterium]
MPGRTLASVTSAAAFRVFLLMLLFLWMRAGLVASSAPGNEKFELEGQFIDSPEISRSGDFPLVFLHGSTLPFSSHTRAGADGRFRFKGLLAGSYTLTVHVAGIGEFRRTVQIGPAVADVRRKIHLDLWLSSEERSPARQTVSATQLAIAEAARRDFEKAQKFLSRYDAEGARTHLLRAVSKAPHYAEAWNALGVIAYQTRDYTSAERYFREALKHEPESYAPLVNLGGVLIALGKLEESLSINARAVQLQPEDALAHSQLGQSCYYTGQLYRAETALREAKRLDPLHFSHPQLVLAEVYRARNDIAAMIVELEEFLRLHPDSTAAPAVRRTLQRLRLQTLTPGNEAR